MRKSVVLIPLVLFALTGCHKGFEGPESGEGNVLEKVSLGVSAVDVSDLAPDTKSSIEITNKISFKWSSDDIVGMYPNKGAQAYFEMSDHAGEEVADFNGGGWALKSASTYAVYYPYDYDHRDRQSIPFTYKGQKQKGKGNYNHLADYQFMAHGAATPVDGACNYSMERIEAITMFNLTLPVIATYNSLSIRLKDGSPITVSTHLDISEEDFEISPDETSKIFTVELEQVTTTQVNEPVKFFAMLPPQNWFGKRLIVSVTTADGDCCQAEIDGKNMLHNHAYQYTATLTTDYGSLVEKFNGEDGKWE